MALLFSLTLSSLKAAALLSADELHSHAEQARAYLCQRGFCLEKIPAIHIDPKSPYPASFNKDQQAIYVDGNVDRVASKINLVHELTHAYRFQFNPAEDRWLDEGLSTLNEFLFSREIWPNVYEKQVHTSLHLLFSDEERFYQPNSPAHGHAFFLALYLYRQFGGEDFLRKVLRSPLTGWQNILAAIQSLIKEKKLVLDANLHSKEAILSNFAMAMLVNDQDISNYGLFRMHSSYSRIWELRPKTPMRGFQGSTDSFEIIFAKTQLPQLTSRLVYAVQSLQPFRVGTVKEFPHAEWYIYIKVNDSP